MRIAQRFLLALRERLDHVNQIDCDRSWDESVWLSGCNITGEVEIGRRSRLYQACIDGRVSIGRYTTLWGPNIFISAKIHGATIGSFCSIARDCAMFETFHNPQRTTTYFVEKNLFHTPPSADAEISAGPITVGNDVWIGAGAKIMSGVKISDGAIIGAGAIVTRDVPPYAIFAGNPARLVRFRFNNERIAELLETKWWLWPEARLLVEQDYLLELHENPTR